MMRVASPKLKALIEKKGVGVIQYNHHYMEDTLKSSDVKEINISYGACTTYLVEELINREIEITKEEALLYLLGIFADTGYFTYPNTTPQDLKIAAYLMERDINMKLLNDFLKDSFESSAILLK